MGEQVVTELVIDSGGAQSGAAAFERAMDSAEAAANKGLGAVNDGAARVNATMAAVGLGAGGAITLFLDWVGKANKGLADLDQTARQTGLTLERIQGLKFGANVNGLSDTDFNAGLQRSASLLNDAQRNANSLTKLFESNGLAVKNANGQLITENQLLETAANLIKRAGTEQDKIKIAEMLGFTRQWVPYLEQGATAMNDLAAEAKAAGLVIDDDTIKKAADFDREWRKSAVTWEANLKAAAAGVLPYIDDLITQAGKIFTKENLKGIAKPGQDLIAERVPDQATLKIDTDKLEKAVQEWKDGGESFLDKFRILFPALWGSVSISTDKPERPPTIGGEGPWQEQGPWLPPGWKPPGPTTKLPANDVAADQYDRAIDQIEKHTARTEADAKAVGLGAAALAEMRAEAALLTAAQQAGVKDTQAFRDKVQDLAQDAGDAALALEKAKVASNIAFNRGAVFLSPEDVSIAQQLRGIYGNDIPAALVSTEAAAIRVNNVLRGIGDAGLDGVRTFVGDLRQGKSAVDALSNALNRVSDKLIDMAISQVWSKAFGGVGAGGGLGGLLSGLFGSSGPGIGETSASAGASSFMMGGQSFPIIGANAAGNDNWPGGRTEINEQGGEIIDLPNGSRIYPNDISQRMATAGVGTPHVTVNLIEDSSRAGQTESTSNGNGGADLNIYVDAITAKNASTPGSATSAALNRRGQLARR